MECPILKRFDNFAGNIKNKIGNSVWFISSLYTFIILAGIVFSIYGSWERNSLQYSEPLTKKVAANDIMKDSSNTCDALSKITELQSIYEKEVLSLQDRWLQLTTKLERGDLLTLERDNVMQAASLVQGELGKLRAKHRDIIVAITRSCVTKIVTAKDIMKDSSNTCDALSKITELQSIYEKEVLPLQDRWLQLTTKLERGDLLTLERDNVMQTESLVQDELGKLRAKHRDIIVAITRSCVRE